MAWSSEAPNSSAMDATANGVRDVWNLGTFANLALVGFNGEG